MINVFGVGRLGSETPQPLAGAETPPWLQSNSFTEGCSGGGRGGAAVKTRQFSSRNQSSHSPQPLKLLSPCVNRKSLLLPTRSLLLHGQFLSMRCTQCYLADCAVNVNLSLNPLLKGERPNKRCQVMLVDSLTDAHGVGLLIQTSCVDLK